MLDLGEVKQRQHAAWSSGDYTRIGTTLQLVGENLCEALDLRAGWRVLDVAAGNGNATLAAARRGATVTSTDYVTKLLDHGRERARAERAEVDFRMADAEALPFADEDFDAVLSTFGVMFTPDQEVAAREMLRVCRPDGRIGLACWTPEGFIGQVLATVGRHLPPPATGMRPATRWGTVDGLAQLFPIDEAEVVSCSQRYFMFRYPSTRAWLEIFARLYGPMVKAFEALPHSARSVLSNTLIAVADGMNRADDGTMVVPGAYLEVVIRRR